jgi:hypothetical protein
MKGSPSGEGPAVTCFLKAYDDTKHPRTPSPREAPTITVSSLSACYRLAQGRGKEGWLCHSPKVRKKDTQSVRVSLNVARVVPCAQQAYNLSHKPRL